MYYMYYGWLFIPVMILAFYAQSKVRSNYRKYAQVKNMRGLTGYEVARQILATNELHHVKIERGRGQLTDHYNPKTETVVLSPGVYDQATIASASIAAHECGHVLQHAEAYGALSIRTLIAGPAQFVSKSAGFLAIGGILLSSSGLIWLLDLAIISYIIITLFHVVTLPVELNASRRAIGMLTEYGLVYEEDIPGTKKVLSAAALTYIAAMLSAMVSTLRLILIRNRR